MEELRFNGKIYRKVNGKWELVKDGDIVIYNGKSYRKIFDELGTDPKETCIKSCSFCERDDEGEPCCGAPDERFWGCSAGFHWEEV